MRFISILFLTFISLSANAAIVENLSSDEASPLIKKLENSKRGMKGFNKVNANLKSQIIIAKQNGQSQVAFRQHYNKMSQFSKFYKNIMYKLVRDLEAEGYKATLIQREYDSTHQNNYVILFSIP